jgi:hypothetical protein
MINETMTRLVKLYQSIVAIDRTIGAHLKHLLSSAHLFVLRAVGSCESRHEVLHILVILVQISVLRPLQITHNLIDQLGETAVLGVFGDNAGLTGYVQLAPGLLNLVLLEGFGKKVQLVGEIINGSTSFLVSILIRVRSTIWTAGQQRIWNSQKLL